MSKTKTVWKVVRKIEGTRFSAILSGQEGGICYNEPGTPTPAPKGTRLLAFRRLKDAKAFVNAPGYHEIWKAEAKDTKKQDMLVVMSLTWWLSVERIARFWRGGGLGGLHAPDGTVSCSELTLIKKVG